MFWTSPQRRGLSVVLAIILIAAGMMLLRNRVGIPAQLPESGHRADELLTRLDPNTASADELAALPGIGPAVAGRIVQERESFARARPGQVAFKRLEDLERVSGIGEMTLKQLEPYLAFPAGK